jgi:hypothetical protein
MAQLDKLRTEKLNAAATTIQRFVRGFLAVRYYAKVQRSVLILQSAVRARAARKVAQALREQRAAVNIQRWWRGHVARKQYQAARQAILRIQAIWRGRTARARFDALRRQQAAIDLQVRLPCSSIAGGAWWRVLLLLSATAGIVTMGEDISFEMLTYSFLPSFCRPHGACTQPARRTSHKCRRPSRSRMHGAAR